MNYQRKNICFRNDDIQIITGCIKESKKTTLSITQTFLIYEFVFALLLPVNIILIGSFIKATLAVE